MFPGSENLRVLTGSDPLCQRNHDVPVPEACPCPRGTLPMLLKISVYPVGVGSSTKSSRILRLSPVGLFHYFRCMNTSNHRWKERCYKFYIQGLVYSHRIKSRKIASGGPCG